MAFYLSVENDSDFFERSKLREFLLEFPLRRVQAEAEDAETGRDGRLFAIANVPTTVRHGGPAGRYVSWNKQKLSVHEDGQQTKAIFFAETFHLS